MMSYAKTLSALFLAGLTVQWISACTTTTTSESIPMRSSGRKEPPKGFFERLADEFTERECNVFRFTCPYGLGPADEPCECTEPNGVVLKGRTIK